MNLLEISTRLGVSVSTVSRALRNAEGVDSRTRAKVLSIAAKGGYKRPARTRQQKAGKTRTLLVLSRQGSTTFQYGSMAGMSQAAIGLNVSILTHQAPKDAPESILIPRLQPPAMRAGQIDGIILLDEWPEAVVRSLQDWRPVVALLHDYPSVDLVGIDAASGMDLLVAYLMEVRHGLCGFYGPGRDTAFSLRLKASFLLACMARGIVPHLVSERGTDPHVGPAPRDPADTVRHLSGLGVKSWICPDSDSAERLLGIATVHGLRVPDDLGIAVFSPTGTGTRTLRQWTSLDYNADDLGVAAVRRILHRLEAPEESHRKILLDARIAHGDTTPAPTNRTSP